ncbi:membrane protein of ER body-like protein [Rosa rugosa]|uniref:membrane protein of ER body-like protein n=1 Tax=Rosa rugosa TaxID=74645 RepID=UPI002B401044|nr:membrane protein of ER body-like protein [Rosa rugosa]
MEATREQWEENEEVGMDLRGRPPRQIINTITSGEHVVCSSQSSSEAESLNAEEEEEEAKGSPRNGFRMVSDKNGTESSYASGFNGGEVEYLISKKISGSEIVASEVESLSFQKSVEAKRQDDDYIKLKDEELPGFGALPGEVEYLISKTISGSEIVASEVESLSFQKSVEAKRQDDDYIKLKDEELPGFGALPSTQSIEQNERSASLENGKAEHGKVKLRDISEQEVSELYLERVYEKPAAHEFYCPNCNSCITKVLIRERELENRPETIPLPEPIDTIRCTSCFSFLIPAGNWFFLKAVAKEEEHPTVQGINIEDNVGASVPSYDSNGTIQDQNSQVASVGKGSLSNEYIGPSRNNLDSRIGVELPVSPQDSKETLYDKRPPTPAQSIGINQAVSVDKAPEPYLESRVGVELPVSPQDSNETFYYQNPPMPAQSDGGSEATLIGKAPEPYLESRVGVELPVSPQDSKETFNDQNPPMPAQSVGVSEALLIDKAPVPGDFVEASINGVQVPVPSYDSNGTLHDQKSPLPGQSVVSITVTTQPPAPEIDDAGPAETKPRESTTVIIRSGGPTIISEPSDAKTFEILKSIVYGGLTEAIASLSIVTSAASAGTATLNILALALANLLGGLFIIGHHLWELKVDQSRVTSGETDEQVDRYEEVLGKRENFFLHASVAILSFLIFGLVPPLVYCFSFRQSNDTDLKLAVVAASSLLCIILLSTGKAYIQRPQKYMKTLLYYIIIGVGAAGISYLAGDLIDKLIEKLGWFNSTVSGTLPLPQMSIVKPAWKSW